MHLHASEMGCRLVLQWPCMHSTVNVWEILPRYVDTLVPSGTIRASQGWPVWGPVTTGYFFGRLHFAPGRARQ